MRRASIGFLLIFAVGLAAFSLGLFLLIRYGLAIVPALNFVGGAIITVFAMARLIDEATR